MKFNRTIQYFVSFFLMVLLYQQANGQIIAGVATGNYYVDIQPDSVMQAAAVHLSIYPPDSCKLDVDSDGVMDIGFYSYGNGGLGGGSGFCRIVLLNSYVQLIAHSDTFITCCPSYVTARLADTLNYGEIIDTNKSYISTSAFIWSSAYGLVYEPYINAWNNIG